MKKYYIIAITAIMIIAISVFGVIKANKKYGFFQSEETAERIYSQGLADIKSDNLQNAYYNFSKISRYSVLYEAALFRQGIIATELNDNVSAIKSYETLLERFPNTFFAEKSIYNLAVAYYNNNQPEKAYANFKIITKKYNDSDFADASNYFLGLLSKNDKNDESAKYFIKYIQIAPHGRYSLNSIDEIQKSNIILSNKENLAVGIALQGNGQYDKALRYFNLSNYADAWPYLVISYKKTGNTIASEKAFIEGISKYSENGSEIQENAIDEYISSNKINGLKNVKSLCDKSKCQLGDYILYKLIPSADKKTKIEYYNTIYTNYPNGDYAADALFNSLFNDYIDGNYENAIIKAKKHISSYSDKKSAPATMYWLARIYGKKHNTAEENSLYNKILANHKDSYYAFLAYKRLNKSINPYEITDYTLIPEAKQDVEFPILHSTLSINDSKKIDKLIKLNDFKIFEYADFDNEIIKSWVGYYEGDLAKSSVIAEKIVAEKDVKPNFSDEIYKLVYPIGYAAEINKYSGKDKRISPYLLLSLIKRESHFNRNTISPSGAMGLTQLMPDTAVYIAQLENIPYNKNKALDAEYNIMLGSTYYRFIKSKYFANDIYALASYNSGYGTVLKWTGSTTAKDFDEFVEMIPYQETKDYIKQIYKNYWAYNSIYNAGKLK